MCSPWLGRESSFLTKASYRFRLRPVTTTPSGFEVGTHEYAFTCTFAAQAGTCILPNGAAVSFRVNEVTASDPDGVRIFAGLRLDPFFMDVPREVETRASRRIAFQAQGTNTLDGLNILSIVVEFDVAKVLGQATRSTASTIFVIITTRMIRSR